VIKSFKFDDDGVSHAAVDLIATLMQPMHDNYNLRQEQLNKASLLSTKAFLEKLVNYDFLNLFLQLMFTRRV